MGLFRTDMKRLLWLTYFLIISILSGAIVLSPSIGLGEKYHFILYRWFSLSRGTALELLFWPTLLLAIFKLFGLRVEAKRGSRLLPVIRLHWMDTQPIFDQVSQRYHNTARDRCVAGAVLAGLFITFLVFVYKSLVWYRFQVDQHWWQGTVDYDVAWNTPPLALGANILNSFGVELPLKVNFLPIEGLAQLFPIDVRIPAAVLIYYFCIIALFWVVGTLIGLNLAARSFFAGVLAILLIIPIGLERIIWFFPPHFFTHQVTLALWWGEAPIVMLATALLFFLIGWFVSPVLNIAAAFGFAVGVFYIVFPLAIGVIFFAPLLAFYCFGFLITAESRREFWWKIGTSSIVGAGMLIARIPRFLANLYSYSFGAYFYEFSGDSPPTFYSDFLFASHLQDIGGLFVFIVSFFTIAVAARYATGPLRRIATATLVCECGIVIGTAFNRWGWQVPLAGAYAELGHAPMWASFFVLALIIAAIRMDQRIDELLQNASARYPLLTKWDVQARHRMYAAGAAVLIVGVAVLQPKETHFSDYPGSQPASIELLRRTIGLAPGSPFRGRLATLLAWESPGPMTLLHFLDLLGNKYRRYLGNDHFIDVLPFNIPTLNQYGYWPSPPTFALFRVFFGRENEQFGRAWFLLTQFDLRMARLLGVRMVVTDSASIPGGTLIYETKAGDIFLRIFEIDKTNVGQYSPTHALFARSATEMVELLKAANFEPTRDVVVENAVLDDLQSANAVAVTVDRGPSMIVRASSPGHSLLVLPIEYSHCLQLHTRIGQPQLIPVNLQQTGLLFDKAVEASITYKFGLFGASICRGEDKQRADALDLKAMLQDNHRAHITHNRPTLW